MLRCLSDRYAFKACTAGIAVGALLLTGPSDAHSILTRSNLSRSELRNAQLEADALAPTARTSPWWRDVVSAALEHSWAQSNAELDSDLDERSSAEEQAERTDVEPEVPVEVSRRPVIVLKMARTGSTWLGHTLRDKAGLCEFHNEVTNIPVVYKGMATANESTCISLAAHVKRRMQCDTPGSFGGITLNPFKFDVHNPSEPGSCWPRLQMVLAKHRPQVIVLKRENVVAQVASELKSIEIQALGLCVKPEDSWHLDRCSAEAQSHLISPDPAKFLAVVREKNATLAAMMTLGQALVPAGESPLQVTMEEMLTDGGDGGLALPPKVLDYIGATPPVHTSKFSLASLGLPLLQATGARVKKLLKVRSYFRRGPAMTRVLANYNVVYTYFAEHAPDLLPLLTKVY